MAGDIVSVSALVLIFEGKCKKMKIDYVNCPMSMRRFWRTSLRPFWQNNVGISKNWSFVCLLCSSSKGKNGGFMAIRMRIHQNFSSSMTTGGYAQISDSYVHMVYLLLLLYSGALVGCPGVSKNKTLNSGIISIVFFSCFKKVSGWCFGFC